MVVHGIIDVSSKISDRLCHKEANQLAPGDGSMVFVYVRKYNRNQTCNNGIYLQRVYCPIPVAFGCIVCDK